LPRHSGINWTTASFAPWRGCQAVSPACASCYSESIHKRAGWSHTWGPHGTRERTSADYWRQPLAWNREAEATRQPIRVFCSHLSDWADNRAPDVWRAELWQLIRATPALTWMLLTKRASLIRRYLPPDWGQTGYRNVWMGCTVEDMACARLRLPALLDIPAAVHWASCEPLLEALDLSPWLGPDRLGFVIAGGESAGKAARPMQPDWARSLRDSCARSGAAFWFKQVGSAGHDLWPGRITGKGDTLYEWPRDLCVQQLPT
jgi:protein gp37